MQQLYDSHAVAGFQWRGRSAACRMCDDDDTYNLVGSHGRARVRCAPGALEKYPTCMFFRLSASLV